MTAYSLFKFPHVLTMFAAVSATLMTDLLLHRVGRSSDVAGIRSFLLVPDGIARLIPVLFLGGAVLGLITAAIGGLDFFRPWLLASYVVLAISLATGVLVSGRWADRVREAAYTGPTHRRSPELEAAVRDPRAIASTAVLLGGSVTIVFLMVVKPGA